MKKSIALILALTMALSLAACGNSGNTNSNAPDETDQGSAAEEQSKKQTTLTVGLANGIPKISILDEDGNWQGYDYETLVKIDELLPQYAFVYEPINDFQAAFVGLDSKAFDLLSVHASWTEERAEKYLYGEASTQ
jgi:ABC-type amino acid transport substrate-binding protein